MHPSAENTELMGATLRRGSAGTGASTMAEVNELAKSVPGLTDAVISRLQDMLQTSYLARNVLHAARGRLFGVSQSTGVGSTCEDKPASVEAQIFDLLNALGESISDTCSAAQDLNSRL